MIACVHVPYFATAIACHDDPALSGVPLLSVQYGVKRSKVVGVSAEAAVLGAAPGLSLSRAQGMCPGAQCVSFDAERTEAAVDRLLEVLWLFTNCVEVASDGFPQHSDFYLDLGTLRPDDSAIIASRLLDAVRHLFPTPIRVGLAHGKFPAYVAAVTAQAGELHMIARGEEAALLAAQPVQLLPMRKATARLLDILCIRQIGQLAALPRDALAGQFGREGMLLFHLAHGLDSRPVNPRKLPKVEHVRRDFDDAITQRARLEVVVHVLADALAQRLAARQTALHALTLTLHFERGSARTEKLHLLQPVSTAASITGVIGQLLDRAKINQGVTGIEIDLSHLVTSIPRQLELFTHRPAQQQLIDLAYVLTARHGACFYAVEMTAAESLVPESRFRLTKVVAS